ncbi:thermonuclease family protein [Streptosporangium sp. NPDC002524]|uniref:thermonuclease family protein n=1 Tax=Streptosporangium sp. NPDC002524 TaxID=3154537 RepID=UPI0033165F86
MSSSVEGTAVASVAAVPGHVHTRGCRCVKPKAVPPPDLYVYPATVAKVVDGDTLDLLVDVGFGITTKGRFRLSAVWAPELGTPEGEAARDFTQAWVEQQAGRVLVRTFKDRRERYGRYLARVFTEPGADLGAALIDAGHATAEAT